MRVQVRFHSFEVLRGVVPIRLALDSEPVSRCALALGRFDIL
jgi:hypothetical protein